MNLTGAIKNSSIGVRLSLLVVVNSSLALLCAGFTLFGYETYLQRGAASRQLTAQALILAEGSSAALAFSDERAARQTLAAVRGDPQVVECIAYDVSGRLFSR